MMSGENNVAKLQKVREKISKAKRGKPQPNVSKAKTGYKNPAWKKELSQEERLKNKSRLTEDIGYRNFKILVAIRDKNTCVKCGYKSGRNMRVHHLNSYKDDIQNRTNPDNAVLLCNKCHDINFAGSFHNNYGRGNNTKEQFNEYMQEINTFEEDVKGVTI